MPKTYCIYSTHPTAAQARQTARMLLQKKPVACCNILPEAESHYRWKGKLTKTSEWVMLSKTVKARAKPAIKAIRALHPYDVPAIVAWPIGEGEPAFARWIHQETKAS